MTSSPEHKPLNAEDHRAWVEHWRRVGPLLEHIRREELRHFKYEDHLEAIDALLDLAARNLQPRPTSGLVEQQRLFHRAKNERDL